MRTVGDRRGCNGAISCLVERAPCCAQPGQRRCLVGLDEDVKVPYTDLLRARRLPFELSRTRKAFAHGPPSRGAGEPGVWDLRQEEPHAAPGRQHRKAIGQGGSCIEACRGASFIGQPGATRHEVRRVSCAVVPSVAGSHGVEATLLRLERGLLAGADRAARPRWLSTRPSACPVSFWKRYDFCRTSRRPDGSCCLLFWRLSPSSPIG